MIQASKSCAFQLDVQVSWPWWNLHILTWPSELEQLISGSKLEYLLKIYYKCLIRSRNCLPFASTRVHPRFFVGSVLLIFFVFCVVKLCVFMFWVPCCGVHCCFRLGAMFGLILPPLQLFVGGVMSYLCFLCLFAHSGV